MTAVATSENDPVAAAKILKKYADKIESFEIKAGFVDGSILDAAGVNELAELPSKRSLQRFSEVSSLLSMVWLMFSRLMWTSRTAKIPLLNPSQRLTAHKIL